VRLPGAGGQLDALELADDLEDTRPSVELRAGLEVLPAEVGSWLIRFTVTVSPSVTISVGPGICMVEQAGVVVMLAGEKPPGAPLQP